MCLLAEHEHLNEQVDALDELCCLQTKAEFITESRLCEIRVTIACSQRIGIFVAEWVCGKTTYHLLVQLPIACLGHCSITSTITTICIATPCVLVQAGCSISIALSCKTEELSMLCSHALKRTAELTSALHTHFEDACSLEIKGQQIGRYQSIAHACAGEIFPAATLKSTQTILHVVPSQ